MTSVSPSNPDEHSLAPYLPSIYAFVAVALAASYFLFAGFAYVHWEKVASAGYEKSATAAGKVLENYLANRPSPEVIDQIARVALEQDAAQMRASHVRSMILMRTWLRFVSVMVGSVLAIVGALFVFGRINSEQGTTTQIGGGGISLLMTTTWPGLVLAVIGGALVAIPNLASQEIEWRDVAIYLPVALPAQAAKPQIDHAEAIKSIENAFRPVREMTARTTNDAATPATK